MTLYLDTRTARLHREVAEVQIDRYSNHMTQDDLCLPTLPTEPARDLYHDEAFIDAVSNLI